MRADAPLPSPDAVRSASDEFDRQDLADPALQELVRWAPSNTDPRHVLIKVVSLNRLYSTQIFAVTDMAAHIVELGTGLDRALAVGEPEIVERIAKLRLGQNGRIRNYFSFATKYCSMHKLEAYPIYDTNVYNYLHWLRKHHGFECCVDRPDWSFADYRTDIDRLRSHYGLDDFTYKHLDKFFWTYGAKDS